MLQSGGEKQQIQKYGHFKAKGSRNNAFKTICLKKDVII